MTTTKNSSASGEAKKFEEAAAAVRAGEAAGLSARTMSKRWAAYFKAEDALKEMSSWK